MEEIRMHYYEQRFLGPRENYACLLCNLAYDGKEGHEPCSDVCRACGMLNGWTVPEARAIHSTVTETAFAPVRALHAIMEALGYQHLGFPPEFLPASSQVP